MKLRKLKSFSIRHYDINEVEKREKKIWKETSSFQKVLALLIGWMLIASFLGFIIYALVFSSDLNSVELQGGYSVTQEEYSCLVSGNSCEICVIDDVYGCAEVVEGMHSEQ